MSAKLSGRQSGPGSDVPVSRVRARWFIWPALAAGAGAVAVGSSPRMSGWLVTSHPAAVVAAVVVAGMLFAVLVAAVRPSRGQRRQRPDDAPARVEDPRVGSAAEARGPDAPPGEVPAIEEIESHSERVLRLLVASLEAALEGQDERVAEAADEGRRAALLTIAGLRETLAQQSGEIALNRVEAALGRLGAAPSFDRPTLTSGASGAPPVFLGAPQSLVTQAVSDATGHTPDRASTAVAGPSTTEGLIADAPLETLAAPAPPATDPTPAAPVRPVVEPVPAPVPQGTPRSPSAGPHHRRKSTRGRRLKTPRNS